MERVKPVSFVRAVVAPVVIALALPLALTQCFGGEPEENRVPSDRYVANDPANIAKKLGSLTPFTLEFDYNVLSEGERALLDDMVEAGRLIDEIYLHQSYAKSIDMFAGLKRQYEADRSEANRQLLEWFWICKGPYDGSTENWESWMGGKGAVPEPMPKGRNFYPAGLTTEAFTAWVKSLRPDEAEAAKSDFTMIRREDGDLKAVPYSDALAKWTKPLAATLERAASRVKGTSLGDFLSARAKAIAETNDYEDSDALWIAMNGLADDRAGNIDITVGPYENYADELMKRKAAFQLYVGVLRPSKTKQLRFYGEHIHKMDDRLWSLYQLYCRERREVAPGKRLGGGDAPVRWGKPGEKVTLVAIDLAYSAGYANEQTQTLAFNLPNVAAWQEKYGTKKVMMMNMLDGKFIHILRPIADLVMAEGDRADVAQELFTDNTVRHEVAHGIGPSGITVGGKKTTVRERQQKYYSAFEEAKAEIVSLLFGYYLQDQGLLDAAFTRKMATTYTASTFRTVRFGPTSDHAKGKVFEFNRLVQNGGIKVDDNTFSVDHTAFRVAVEKLAMEIIDIQMNAEARAAKALLETVGKASASMTAALETIDGAGIPRDLRVRYTFGENYSVVDGK